MPDLAGGGGVSEANVSSTCREVGAGQVSRAGGRYRSKECGWMVL